MRLPKQTRQLAEQLKNVPVAGRLQKPTVVEFVEMAKGMSLSITKQDVIDWLDELWPGVQHSNLSGKALIAAKKKHRIDPLNNKQLIKALREAAGEELANKAKQGSVEASKKEWEKVV